ncbi:hypothetical protein LPE509_02573 [Legionella pneumophila subsp. pneumophila LPE509]|nr:hypothetical protein LPE509_02573 [Legionella pneumophila subsp. pneumophila LPE509]
MSKIKFCTGSAKPWNTGNEENIAKPTDINGTTASKLVKANAEAI